MGRRTALTVAATVLAMTAAACGTVTSQGSPGTAPLPPPGLATSLATTGGTWAVAVLGGPAAQHDNFWQLFVRPATSAAWRLVTPPGVASNGGLVLAGRGRAVGYRGLSAQPGPGVLAAGQQRRQRHQLAARRAGRRSGRRPGRPGRGPRQRPSARPARQREDRAGRTGRGGMVAADQRARAGRDPGGPPVRPGHRGRGRLLAVRRPAARRDLLAPGRGRHLLLRRRDLAPGRAGAAPVRGRPAGAGAAADPYRGRRGGAAGRRVRPVGRAAGRVEPRRHALGSVRPAQAGRDRGAGVRLRRRRDGLGAARGRAGGHDRRPRCRLAPAAAAAAAAAALAFGPAGSVDALAAAGSRLTVWRLARESAAWHQVQVLHVPVAYGSSG